MNAQSFWCSIAYYELEERVGEQWFAPADVEAIHIDGSTDPNNAAGAVNRLVFSNIFNFFDHRNQYFGS